MRRGVRALTGASAWVALLGGLSASAGCRRESSPKAGSSSEAAAQAGSSDAQFWKWFAAHASEVGTIETGQEPAADALADALHAVDEGLTFETGTTTAVRELIISADGAKKVFPVVTRLVASAPPIAGWKVIAFRPRKAGLVIKMNGVSVGPDDIRFHAERAANAKLDVDFYVKGPTITDETKQAIYILLDSIVGEYDTEMRLAGIDIHPAADAPADARPLHDLPALVDTLK